MPLPAKIQVSSALARGARFQGKLLAASLPRLRETGAVVEDLEVDIELSDEAGSWLRGSVAGTLDLECQRCLKRFPWALRMDLRLRLVGSEEEEARVIAECETCLIEDDSLALRDAIEDEILLALPMTPRCGACEAVLSAAPQTGDNGRESPFAALKQLKRN